MARLQAIAYMAAMATNCVPPLHILIAAPRGFCAGVDRAINIVELAIELLRARRSMSGTRSSTTTSSSTGCAAWARCSSTSWTRCPTAGRWCFRAHGVPKSVPAAAEARGLDYLDATCPLVSKVHRQAQRLIEDGRHILFIGHDGHPEVVGTFGQVPDGRDDPGRDARGGRGGHGRRSRQSRAS